MSAAIHIALIDDDDGIREAVADVLINEGYLVDIYVNGKEALEGISRNEPPGMIICDLIMPVMNGWQFLEAKALSKKSMEQVPVMVISATPDLGTLEYEAVREVVQKPFDLDRLLRLVGKHCGRP